MAQQGKQMRGGIREGFAYNSVRMVLLANGNMFEVDYNTFFLSGEEFDVIIPFRIRPCPTLTFFDTHSYL
jgi:hypothetical protein